LSHPDSAQHAPVRRSRRFRSFAALLAPMALAALVMAAALVDRAAGAGKSSTKGTSAAHADTGSAHAAAPAPAPAASAPMAAPPKSAGSAPGAGVQAGPQELDRIAAVVNDEVVLQSDVDEQVYLFLQRNNTQPDSVLVDTLRRQVLDQMISEKLIVAEAKRQGITVNPTEVERQVDQAIADARQRLGSDDAYRAQLARENLTEDKLREKYRTEVERQLLAQRLVQKQLPPQTVTQTEAETYWKANPDKFPKLPAQARLSVIQIPVSADSAALAAGKKQAAAARKRIVAGEKFAKVASEVSQDPGSAKSGGDLGFFTRGTMDPAFEDAVFSLKPGVLSEPVQSTFGWHIIEVLDRDSLRTAAGTDSLGPDGKKIPEVHARHILIRVPLTDADAERAHKLADHVCAEARKGTDFGALVRRYSHYAGKSGEGGDIGYVATGGLQENIRRGLDSLETGQVSDPLANAIGYNIFKITDRKPERPYTLDEIRPELQQAVGEIKQRERYDAWVKTLRSKAHVEIRS
jgi:peptidyl-prolyl cis-trans isomerase SurA